jgi:hypothetical protein
MKTGGRRTGSTFDALRTIALQLPGVEDALCYGTPGLRVNGKFMLRLKEDGDTVAISIPMDDREVLLAADPQVFHLTDHYRGYPAILFRLSRIEHRQLVDLIALSWRSVAPRKLVASRETGRDKSAPRR